MYRIILVVFTVLLFIFPTYSQTVTPKECHEQMEKMRQDAKALLQSSQHLSGEAFTKVYDKYIDIMNARVAQALKFVAEVDFESLGKDDLLALLKIAESARNELKQAGILGYLFEKYPEIKDNPKYQQQFLLNSALMLPELAEPYMSAPGNIPLPEIKIIIHFVLAAGFTQSGNLNKARYYLEQGNLLVQPSLTDSTLQKERYLSQVAEVNIYLVYRIYGKEAAYEALQKARPWIQAEWFNDKLKNIQKKLDVLAKPASSLQTEYWIGADANIDLNAFRGKVVLLDFFRWSCGACNARIPQLRAIRSRFTHEEFVIIGVTDYQGQYDHEKNVSKAREYELMRDHYCVQRQVNWPISMSETAMNNYGIDRTPTYFLIDKNGLVREWDAMNSESYLAERIKALVEEAN